MFSLFSPFLRRRKYRNPLSVLREMYIPLPSLPVHTYYCEGISLLGYWQEVNQSPTQTKPYNTLPPFEQRDSWSSYGAVRAYSDVLL